MGISVKFEMANYLFCVSSPQYNPVDVRFYLTRAKIRPKLENDQLSSEHKIISLKCHSLGRETRRRQAGISGYYKVALLRKYIFLALQI